MPRTRNVIFHDLPDIPGIRAVEGYGVTNEFPRHVHRRYVIGLMDHGERTTEVDGHAVPIPAGNLFLLGPDIPHTCRTKEHDYRIFAVTPERMAETARDIFGTHAGTPRFTTFTQHDPQAATLFDHAFATIRDGADIFGTESVLADLLLLILSRYAEQPDASEDESTAKAASAHDAVQRAKKFLRERFHEKIRLRDAAEAACLSPFRLQRVFTAETGISPHEYMIQCRIRQARHLLEQGLPPAEVAAAVGFYDQSHFSTQFRRITGVPPGKFDSKGT